MKGPVLCLLCVLCTVCVDCVSSARLAWPDNSAKCRDRYGYRYFYDHGTDHCEQCREICQKGWGTERQCNSECPLYLEAVKCGAQEDKYYDEGVDKCSPCSELCDNHQVTGTTRDCREKCSGYLDKMTPKQVPSLHKQNYLKAMDGSDAAQESQTMDLLVHPGWIAAMAVGAVALVCVVVVVIVFYWTCKQQRYGLAPQIEEENNRVVEVEVPAEERRRPVEETSQGTSGSQHFAIDGASSTLPTTVAFAELPVHRNAIARV
eukprot:TRINITY_DN19933_c0_g2_i1.p1 TRINITY_DN19933_c0_g2~~TRINITY_DN19933_c0_g2_i1.p1  ORF type:complete len:262 (+),score=56.41 TRINITY_DN19933_c0_g2_i1:161-946(+)